MLFDETAFANAGKRDLTEKVEIERKRRRWDPIQAGFVCLARIVVGPREEGNWGSAWHKVTYVVQALKGEKGAGREFKAKFHVGGTTSRLKALQMETASQIKMALLCYDPAAAAPFTVDRVNGLIVPIVVTLEQKWEATPSNPPKMINSARIVCAHPSSRSYDDYLALCERIGPASITIDGGEIIDRVPGWRLYPNGKAIVVMDRMQSRVATQADEDFMLEGEATKEVKDRAAAERRMRAAAHDLIEQHLKARERRDAVRDAELKVLATSRKLAKAREAYAAAKPGSKGRDAAAETIVDRALRLRRQRDAVVQAEAKVQLVMDRAERARSAYVQAAYDHANGIVRKSKEREAEKIVMTRAEIEAGIARPVSDWEKRRRAEAAEAAANAVPTPAVDEEMTEERREAIRDRLMTSTKSRGYVNVIELAQKKRQREFNEMLDRSERAAKKRKAEEARRAADADLVDGIPSWDLPKDHPQYCPF